MIPLIVEHCCDVVERKGLETVGVYRYRIMKSFWQQSSLINIIMICPSQTGHSLQQAPSFSHGRAVKRWYEKRAGAGDRVGVPFPQVARVLFALSILSESLGQAIPAKLYLKRESNFLFCLEKYDFWYKSFVTST